MVSACTRPLFWALLLKDKRETFKRACIPQLTQQEFELICNTLSSSYFLSSVHYPTSNTLWISWKSELKVIVMEMWEYPIIVEAAMISGIFCSMRLSHPTCAEGRTYNLLESLFEFSFIVFVHNWPSFKFIAVSSRNSYRCIKFFWVKEAFHYPFSLKFWIEITRTVFHSRFKCWIAIYFLEKSTETVWNFFIESK